MGYQNTNFKVGLILSGCTELKLHKQQIVHCNYAWFARNVLKANFCRIGILNVIIWWGSKALLMQGLVGRTKPYSPTFERCRLCYIDVDLVTFVTSSTFQPFILCYAFYYREGSESILPCRQLKDWNWWLWNVRTAPKHGRLSLKYLRSSLHAFYMNKLHL